MLVFLAVLTFQVIGGPEVIRYAIISDSPSYALDPDHYGLRR